MFELIAVASWGEISAAVGCFLALLAAIYGYLTSPNRASAWKDKFNALEKSMNETITEETKGLKKDVADLKNELNIFKEKMNNIVDDIEEIAEDQKDLDNRVLQKMDRIEERLEKFLDVLIQFHNNK